MSEDKLKDFYDRIKLIPNSNTFTLFFLVSLASLCLGIYNNYQIRNGLVSANGVVNGKEVLPIKDLIKNVSTGAHRMGSADAKVVMVAFEDFQCPYCKQFHDQNFDQLKKEYIDTGKILFIHQDLSFLGIESNAAAESAQCAAEQGKFWEYREQLYHTQISTHNAGNFSDDNLKKLARELGLDTASFNNCFDAQKYRESINKTREFADSYGISSTPSFVINGVLVRGARPYSDFKAIIDNNLK